MSFNDQLSAAARRLRDSADFPAPSESLQARVLDSVRIAPVPAPTLRLPLSWIAAPTLVAAMALIFVTALIRAHHLSQGTNRNPQTAPSGGKRVIWKSMTSAELLALPEVQFGLKVQQVVDRQNSWHFEGFQDNKYGRQKWEIWARRDPYFYREQIGGVTDIDDGVIHTKILTPEAVEQLAVPGASIAATPARKAHGSLIYITRSNGLALFYGGIVPTGSTPRFMCPSFEAMSKSGNEKVRIIRHFSALDAHSQEMEKVNQLSSWRFYTVITRASDDAPTAPIFSDSVPRMVHAYAGPKLEQYVFDRTTLLPRHYEMLRSGGSTKPGSIPPYQPSGKSTSSVLNAADQSVLNAEYGIDIPKAALTYTPPPDCPIVDMRLLNSQTFKDNLSIRTDEITQDKDGNISATLTPGLSDKFKANHALQDYFQINTSRNLYGTDENGMVYPLTMMDEGQQPAHFRFWLAPQSPYASTAVRPKRLTLHVPINITTYGPGGLSGGGTGSGGGTALWQTVELTLPDVPAAVPLPTYTIWHIGGQKRYSLAELASVARAKFYENGVPDKSRYVGTFGRKPEISDADRALAAQWWDTASVEAEKVGDNFSARAFKLSADHARNKSKPRVPATPLAPPIAPPVH